MKKIIFVIGLFVLSLNMFAQKTLPYNLDSAITLCDGSWNASGTHKIELDLTNGARPGMLKFEFKFNWVLSVKKKITRVRVSKNSNMSNYREVYNVNANNSIDEIRGSTVALLKDEKYIEFYAQNPSWSSTAIDLKTINVTRSVNIEETSATMNAYVKREPATKTFRVKCSNLTGDLDLKVLAGGADAFSVSPSTLTKAQAEAGYDVTVKYAPQTKDTHDCTIRVSDKGYTDSYDEIKISGKSEYLIQPTEGVLYVDGRSIGETGTGQSWSDALSMDIINEATENVGDIVDGEINEIWVKSGEYTIVNTIKPRGGVGIYGGFQGTELSKVQREATGHATIIKSGNGGAVTIIGNGVGVNKKTVIDCFTIEGTTNARAIVSTTLDLVIHNCIVRNNVLGGNDESGVVNISTASVIENTLFYNNVSAGNGGGLYLSGASTVINCTFVNNKTTGTGAVSSVVAGNTSKLYNCIFSGEAVDGKVLVDGNPEFFYNCIVNDNSNILADTKDEDVVQGNGNILNTDPLLDEEFKLTLKSPCIDAGNNANVPAELLLDLYGNTRIQNDTVDMGTFEYRYYMVTGVVVGTGEGEINGIGNHRVNDVINLTPNLTLDLYRMVSAWEIDGKIVSLEKSYSFVLTKETEVTMHVADKYGVSIRLSNLKHIYDGDNKAITYTTIPEDIDCVVTYKKGEDTITECIEAGSYTVAVAYAGAEEYMPYTEEDIMVIAPSVIEVVEQPTASGLIYEQPLSESIITGGSMQTTLAGGNVVKVEGVLSWTNPNELPNAGSFESDATFTPNNSNYEVKKDIKVVVNVAKTNPTIIEKPTAQLVYNQVISDSELTNGKSSAEGVFSWSAGTIITNATGEQEFMVTFTPKNLDNYYIIEFPVMINVEKADIHGIIFDGMTATYTGKEQSIAIVGMIPEGTTVEYINCSVTNVGVYDAKAIIHGGINYNDLELDAVLMIVKATFTTDLITFKDKIVKYDGKEHLIEIEGVLPEGGIVVYTNNAGTEYGEYVATARITEAVNYEDSEVMTATLTITDKTIVSVDITNSEFTYDGGVKGVEYVLTPNHITLNVVYRQNGMRVESPINAGDYEYEITYIADEEYSGIHLTGTMTITKATPVLANIACSDLIYGQYLQELAITGDANVEGVFEWINGDIIKPMVGQYVYDLVFIPSDEINYNRVEGLSLNVNVAHANSTITEAPKASDIYCGQPLSESILTGGVSTIDGTFSWLDGSILYQAGVYNAEVVFTPTDIENYSIKRFTVLLNVKVREIEDYTKNIKFEDKSVTYDGELQAIQISGNLPEGVSVYYRNNMAIDAGVYEAVAIIDGGTDYSSLELMAKLTIAKADIKEDITFEGKTVTYNGMYHWLEIDEALLPLGASVSYTNNEALRVGVYHATANVNGGKNYNDIDEMTATLEIKAAEIKDITFKDVEVGYDGNLHTMAITGKMPLGVRVSYSNNYGVNVGSYNATATLTGLNFETVELGATMTINKADINGITFENKTITYDGNYHSLEIAGTLPIGVGLVYHNNRGRDAATYNAIAMIDGGGNYNSRQLTADLKIEHAQISGITFAGKSVVYNGEKQIILIDGTLPLGLNVTYINNDAVNAGVYNAKAVISGDNFKTVELAAVLEIKKATAEIVKIPVASGLNSSDILSKSKLSGGEANIAGTFAWENADVIVTESSEYAVIFTPIDAVNYNPIKQMVAVSVSTPSKDGEELPTGVESITNVELRVTSYGKNIQIRVMEGEMMVDGYDVFIYDISGRMVNESRMESKDLKITMDKAGMYVVKVTSNDSVVKTHKVMVN